jgi:hypothetical protein
MVTAAGLDGESVVLTTRRRPDAWRFPYPVTKTLPDAHTNFILTFDGSGGVAALTLVLVAVLALVLLRWKKRQ